MLRLKLPTDPRWADVASKNISEILSDHAFCEQKAASTAISIIVNYPEYTPLVEAMADLAREEMAHFQMVLHRLKERNLTLARERSDEYVNQLRQFMPGGLDRRKALIYRLLLAAMIEARSCERFKVLSQNLSDPELAAFYASLVKSEAGHYSMFLGFARQYGAGILDVEKLWQDFLEFEAHVIAGFGTDERIHG
jgi:tRNA-(ms[2]io[6]A)-hydroxylase